jgi:uncharacterized membrane protein YeaQ/YmgE (transglycosylase-associated protein family)
VEWALAILVLAVWGFVVGALARFAVPGPDPMPVWFTIVLGLSGSFLGAGVGYTAGGTLGALLFSVIVATLIVIVYRRVVQKRPVTGPEAMRPPTRGLGIRRRRAARHLAQLEQLKAAGLLTNDEFETKRTALLARGKP